MREQVTVLQSSLPSLGDVEGSRGFLEGGGLWAAGAGCGVVWLFLAVVFSGGVASRLRGIYWLKMGQPETPFSGKTNHPLPLLQYSARSGSFVFPAAG